MYDPPTFLTKEFLLNLFDKYTWSENIEISDLDVALSGIQVNFPQCMLYFKEGFESNMSLSVFDRSRPGKHWSSFELIHYIFDPLRSRDPEFNKPNYHGFSGAFASENKVRNGLEDLCMDVQVYLIECVKGDFSIVDNYEIENEGNAFGLRSS